MIPFFRKLRQKFIFDSLPATRRGKMSTYLAYAIGEIILVVLGILIALQVNNWNENQKNSVIENTYYCRILEDFEQDRKLIFSSIALADEKIEYSKQLILDLHRSEKDKQTLLNDWIKTIRLEVFVPRTVAFDNLNSSGNLNLLKNLDLRNALSQFYSNMENILRQINQNRDELVERSYPENAAGFGLQEVEYMQMSLGSKVLEVLPKIDWIKDENHIYFKKFESDLIFNIAMYERHKQHLNRILDEIEEPLNRLEDTCKKIN
ncbi:DUF6090 family protein [Portibacter marinus]|uniref:DUF6090 family protein n=1 Tax=Portibacter marinus TaxID=2898660 RepID=UPI001F29D172|nr:DUF6090 family protein [Portibacter marinus]